VICGGGMGLDKQVDEQPFDLRRVIADLVIARGLRLAQFQPVERRFAGQWRAIRALRFQPATQYRHHRVVAQCVVVDQILVTQRDPENPLTHQTRHRVFNQFRCAVIREALGKPRDQSDRPVAGAEQHRPGLRGHPAAVEPATTARPSTRATPNRSALHSVSIGLPRHPRQTVLTTRFSQIQAPDAPTPLRNAG
jgi:hypothetical protein